MLATVPTPTESGAAVKTGTLPIGPINTRTVSARLGISVASPDITLDGRPCGRIVREVQGARGVWVATLTDVEGHRGGLIENGSFAEVQKQVVLKVVDILRRHYPDADWGALTLNATPGELAAIRDGTRRVLRYAYAARFSGKACPVGRHVIIANYYLRRQDREYLHGKIVEAKKVPREKVVAEDPNLRWSFPNDKSIAEIYFDLCPYGSASIELSEEIQHES